MIISGVKCDKCNRTDVGEFKDKNIIVILYKMYFFTLHTL